MSFCSLLIEQFSCKMKGGVAALWVENTNDSGKLSVVCENWVLTALRCFPDLFSGVVVIIHCSKILKFF